RMCHFNVFPTRRSSDLTFRELGWFGFFGAGIFVILLFVVLFYEWRNGALDFGPDGKKILKAYKKLTSEKSKAEEITRKINGTQRSEEHTSELQSRENLV